MPFTLRELQVNGRKFSISSKSGAGANNITLVTGANGTGKTRLLTGLAAQYSGRVLRGTSQDGNGKGTTSASSLSEPALVVAQTFSPFSRLPAERARTPSLDEYLRPPPEKYVAIGFTRSAGLRKSVSKDAISRIARKLYTQPAQAEPLARALQLLGFDHKLRIEYYRSPVGPGLAFKESNGALLSQAIEAFLASLAAKSSKSGEESRIAREIASQPRVQLAKKLREAIEAVQPLLPEDFDERGRQAFAIDLPLHEAAEISIGELEGAIILARLGLLRVSDCLLWPIRGGRWGQETQGKGSTYGHSIVDASSGEQQLLSSLFGLVAEMQDDSLVLIDEPELSLHPSWQTQFLDLLSSVLSPFKGCHVVVATHSPLLAQRGAELGLSVLSLDDTNRASPDADSSTSVEQTLVEVFELPVRDSIYVSRLLLALVMAAENSADSAATSRVRVMELKALYERAAIPDESTLALINDALSIIDQRNDQEPVEDSQ